MTIIAIGAGVTILAWPMGFIIDLIRGARNDLDAKLGTRRSDMRVSSLYIVMAGVPIFIVGVAINYFE